MHDRERLIVLLQDLLDAFGEDTSDRIVLQRAITGLDRLNHGQVDPIFTPVTGKHGAKPGAAAEIKARAVGLLDVLKLMGEKVGDSEIAIANEMKISVDSLQSWKKALAHSDDNQLMEVREVQTAQYEALVALKKPPSKHDILVHAKELGVAYTLAKAKN